jgi:4'-phosphopantetheinyl transferase
MNNIFPIIIRIPEKERECKGKDLVASLSRFARKGLSISAEKLGKKFNGKLRKDKNGAPIPEDGIYWSLAHKSEYAAGVAATYAVGIDLERIKTYRDAIKNKIADQIEWNLGGSDPPHDLFFRYWTAKEAVLKATGQGLKGLSTCRIIGIPDRNSLKLDCMNKKWIVEHFYFDGHIASVVKDEYDIIWSVL